MNKLIVAIALGWIPFLLVLSYFMLGCTINLQNTDTHGRTDDLIDEQIHQTFRLI